MTTSKYNVLFLCTGNSARSVMSEVLLNHWAGERFNGYSAGSFPKDDVHPLTLKLLQSMDLDTHSLRSKSWDEFIGPTAPEMHFVFTVCDNAATETCPIWPGAPMTAHWGIPDPAAAEGDETQKLAAFRTAFRELESRIRLFAALPVARLDRMAIQQEIDTIGKG